LSVTVTACVTETMNSHEGPKKEGKKKREKRKRNRKKTPKNIQFKN